MVISRLNNRNSRLYITSTGHTALILELSLVVQTRPPGSMPHPEALVLSTKGMLLCSWHPLQKTQSSR